MLRRSRRASDGVSLQARDARPEPDVHRGGVLRLEAAHPFEDAGERRSRSLEQHLAREQGAIQLALGECALGHAVKLSSGRDLRLQLLDRAVCPTEKCTAPHEAPFED